MVAGGHVCLDAACLAFFFDDRVAVVALDIAERAVRLRFVWWVRMMCQRSDLSCQTIILIGLERYEELRESGSLTAPGIPSSTPS